MSLGYRHFEWKFSDAIFRLYWDIMSIVVTNHNWFLLNMCWLAMSVMGKENSPLIALTAISTICSVLDIFGLDKWRSCVHKWFVCTLYICVNFWYLNKYLDPLMVLFLSKFSLSAFRSKSSYRFLIRHSTTWIKYNVAGKHQFPVSRSIQLQLRKRLRSQNLG